MSYRNFHQPGRSVVLASSVGSLPGIDDYVALIDHNVETLARALEKP